jgi:DeoR family glycerol-3-phosphate regulon repressor
MSTDGIRMSRPLAIRRHEEIVRRLRAVGSVSVGELAHAFGVSHETVRRDLKRLAGQGHLDVVHGGAARRGSVEPALAQRFDENTDGKVAIAQAAAALVADGASVLLDSGTTTTALALALVGRRNLSVCTNSLTCASILCRIPGNRVFMLGGEVDGNDEAVFGPDATAALANLRTDIAFIGAGGFSGDGELTDYSRTAAEVRGRMILAGPAYIVADHLKFERRTPFRIPNFDQAAGIIVDRAPHPALADIWTSRGIRVIIASA